MLTPHETAALTRALDNAQVARPTVGRVVHYHSYGTPGGEYLPEPRAAIITAVALAELQGASDQVGLAVLNPTGMFFNQDVPHSPTPKPGHWSWPPRI